MIVHPHLHCQDLQLKTAFYTPGVWGKHAKSIIGSYIEGQEVVMKHYRQIEGIQLLQLKISCSSSMDEYYSGYDLVSGHLVDV